MKRIAPLIATFSCSLLCVLSASATTLILIDDRADSQQKTEARFDAPDGRVITGLGFRAHYDNITTMHVRHHALTPDGQLVDPVETRLGAEPDNPCEGKVYLPAGYVAVGYGAAGEPEWDVTLVRVWARPLRADGTLGEVEEFSDGFNPTRGPERYLLLEESDRVLTGAGLRFQFNDITGLYARSRRIARLSGDGALNRAPFHTHGWLLDHPAAEHLETLRAAIAAHAPTRVDVRWAQGAPDAEQIALLNRLAASAPVHCWLPLEAAASAAALLAAAPALAGLTLDPAGGGDVSAAVEAVLGAGKALTIYAHVADAAQVKALPASVAVLVADLGVETDLGAFGARPVYDYQDIVPVGGLLNVRVGELAGRAAAARLLGCDGFVARVHAPTATALTGSGALNAAALRRLADEPLQLSDVLWASLCQEAFGAQAGHVESALRRTASVNELIFTVFGCEGPFVGERIGTVDELRARLADQSRAVKVLRPVLRDVEDAWEEKETSLWLLLQSKLDLEAALEQEPSEALRAMQGELTRLEAVTRLSQAVLHAFMLGQLYLQDVSDDSLRRAEEALARLAETAAAQPDEPLRAGLDRFVASLRAALERAPAESPLALALARIHELNESGNKREALAALIELMDDPTLMPHLDKRNADVTALVRSLPVLGMDAPDLNLLRGGDGQWGIVEKAGKYGLASRPGTPCIYFDVAGEPLDMGEDFLLSFEYFDGGVAGIVVHYDSDHREDRYYHPSETLAVGDSGAWKRAEIRLTNALFSGKQNMSADFRILPTGEGQMVVRDVRLSKAE